MKRRIITAFLFLVSRGDSRKRAELLRKWNVFHHMGEHCLYQPTKLPAEPKLVSIGNNVNIAANVVFCTHDVVNSVLLYMDEDGYDKPVNRMYLGKIAIKDNVMIGTNSIILYNTTIGPNAIVAAGSVVTKDVPEGTIVGGNPARIIGSMPELSKRRHMMNPKTPDNTAKQMEIETFFW